MKKRNYFDKQEEPTQIKTNDRKMRPPEWAREDKIDPHLFVFWKNNLMTKKEFDELKKQVM